MPVSKTDVDVNNDGKNYGNIGYHKSGSTAWFDHLLVTREVNTVIFCGGAVFTRETDEPDWTIQFSQLPGWMKLLFALGTASLAGVVLTGISRIFFGG